MSATNIHSYPMLAWQSATERMFACGLAFLVFTGEALVLTRALTHELTVHNHVRPRCLVTLICILIKCQLLRGLTMNLSVLGYKV